ncbi:MAG: pyridoxal-phosphate dependent enzyme [Patescibacteria group bacterium]|nr:pyridoxal-phosphate dependent enzyme [Patescibacteria group bacterium]
MSQSSCDQILAHPIVHALNPHTQDFVSVRWLSSRLNPYRDRCAIEIGAAIAFMNLPHIKIVAAFGMMMEDYENGVYRGIDTLVVPSSGNTAHGVALLAPAFGISRVKVVMASDTPEAKKNIITMIPWARLICPEGARKVEDVALEEASQPGSHLLDQYKHLGNMRIHEKCTGPKLLRAAGENLGLVAVGMGSGGTVTGVSRYLKSVRPDIIVLGVRPKRGKRIPGVRDAEQMDAVVTLPYKSAVDAIVEIGRNESFLKTRELLSEVQPQVGPSSGLACVGLLQFLADSPDARELLRGKRAVFISPDDGRFYPGPTIAELDPDQGLTGLL